MKILKNRLENELNIRTEKNYPIQGIEFIDIMPLCILYIIYYVVHYSKFFGTYVFINACVSSERKE